MKKLTAEQKEQLAEIMRTIEELYEECSLICNGNIPHTHWRSVRVAAKYASKAHMDVIWLTTSNLSPDDNGTQARGLEYKRRVMLKQYSNLRYAQQAEAGEINGETK
jgi:hypothetical protein